MDKYFVVGNPVSHSLSPQLHQIFAEQTGEVMTYDCCEIELGMFAQRIPELIAEGAKGFSVTVPFKGDAYALVDQVSDRAEHSKGLSMFKVNDDGTTYGDNQDGLGLVRDLVDNKQVDLVHKRLLICGAGGAARNVTEPLLNESPAEIVIANRTVEKAENLARYFHDLGPVSASDYATLDGQFDVIINATSAGLSGAQLPIPESVLHEKTFCYDMVYNKGVTPFLQWAHHHQVPYADGFGMLVELSAEAFALWRGVRPDTSSIFSQFEYIASRQCHPREDGDLSKKFSGL